MEHVGHQMKIGTCVVESEEQPYNGFQSIYQAMCVKEDLTHCGDRSTYNADELALEVV